MAQHFSLKKGIALFGDKAEQATTEELQAIHDMGTYEPLDASKLTRDAKRDALESLLFITEKRWANQEQKMRYGWQATHVRRIQ